MTKEEIFKKLNQHDWWFRWSDDPYVCQAGYTSEYNLRVFLKAENPRPSSPKPSPIPS